MSDTLGVTVKGDIANQSARDMTFRQYVASQIMPVVAQSMLNVDVRVAAAMGWEPDSISKSSAAFTVILADALIAELEKT